MKMAQQGFSFTRIRGHDMDAANRSPVIAYIALGSNLGDRSANIDYAIGRIASALGVRRTLGVSDIIETAPVGGPPGGQPDFLNAALAIETTLAPRELLELLFAIERERGRVRHPGDEPGGPRTLDLDLLLYGEEIINERPDLIIPHPRLHTRRFVLAPLAQIAPKAIHPAHCRRTIAELLHDLDDGVERRSGDRRC